MACLQDIPESPFLFQQAVPQFLGNTPLEHSRESMLCKPNVVALHASLN